MPDPLTPPVPPTPPMAPVLSVPPLNPVPPPPPVAPVQAVPPPPVQLPIQEQESQSEIDDDAELSRLSPFEVLKNKPSANTLPSREELLRQAAVAPSTSFILPEETAIIPEPVALSVPPPLAVAMAPQPMSPPPSQYPVAPPPQSPPVSRPLSPPVPQAKPHVPMTNAPRDRRSPVLGVIVGLLIALVLLVGGGYALALGGAQIPVLYTMASGLNADGLQLAKQSAVATAKLGYDMSGQISVVQKGSSTTAPSLPSADSSAPATAVAKLSSLVTQNIAAHVATDKWTAQENLVVDASGSVVPVSVQGSAVSANTTWRAYVASNTTSSKLLKIDPSELNKTLLYPAMNLPVVSSLLAQVKTAGTYAKKAEAGVSVASYQYQLDSAKVATLLPNGATVSSATGSVNYAWKTALPTALSIKIDFSYQSVTYTYTAGFNVSHWGGTSLLGGDDIASLNSQTDATLTTPVSFAGQLGIDAAKLPTSLSLVITPSGKTVTAVTDPITSAPPLPSVTVASESTINDTQRLQDLTDLQSALAAYKAANGKYPVVATMEQTRSSKTLLIALVPTYMTAMPVDPLPNSYWYEYSSVDGTSGLLRGVAEDATNPSAKKGVSYSYFERTSN